MDQPQTSDSATVTFAQLGVMPQLCEACEKVGYKAPSDIQKEAIPWALKNRDIIGLAQTGSGKTAAFAIPILQALWENPSGLFACVMAPTRELAYQISEAFESLGAAIGARSVVIVGGMDMVTQALSLSKKPHIIVCTPGRLKDHLENTKGFSLRTLKYLVMDEADRLLDMDFGPQIEDILKVIPQERNTFLFSATMTTKVAKLQRASLRNPVKVEVSSKYSTVDKLIQNYIFFPSKFKDTYLVWFINEIVGKSTIVFSHTVHEVMRLGMLLRSLGMDAIPLHGQLTMERRLGALNKFKSGTRKILIATDVASRGLDIPTVDFVINYDMPTNSKDYIHRVGRTARAGRSGKAITFVTQYDVELLQRIETAIGKKMTEFPYEKDQVMLLQERVTEAQRIAISELKEFQSKNTKTDFEEELRALKQSYKKTKTSTEDYDQDDEHTEDSANHDIQQQDYSEEESDDQDYQTNSRRKRSDDEQDDIEYTVKAKKKRRKRTANIYENYGSRRRTATVAEHVPKQFLLPGVQDPHLWMVKCSIGKERDVVFQLMRRFAEKANSGQPLGIFSAYCRNGLSGVVYLEANSQADVQIALERTAGILSQKLMLVPIDQMVDVIRIKRKDQSIQPGAWVRVKRGKYAGDLAQVLSIIDSTDSAELKLGYLEKEFKLVSLQTDKVNPTLEEITLFSAGDSEALTEAAMAAAAASALENRDDNDKNSASFNLGDKVKVIEGDLIGVSGTVVTLESDGIYKVKINLDQEKNKTQRNIRQTVMSFRSRQLSKLFREGDHVKVLRGKHAGMTGTVVAISGIIVTLISDLSMTEIKVFARDLQQSKEVSVSVQNSTFEKNDLVTLDGGRTVAIVLAMEKGLYKVLDQNGDVSTIKSYEAAPTRGNPKFNVAIDVGGNEIKVNDVVRETNGSNRSGVIIQLNRFVAFVRSENVVENGGIFVSRVRNLAGSAPQKDNLTPFGSRKQPQMQRQRQRPQPVIRGRDQLLGKTVLITRGPFKGYMGVVKNSTATMAKVELYTSAKMINVERDKLNIKMNDGRVVPASSFGDNGYNRNNSGGRGSTGSSPFPGANTPNFQPGTPFGGSWGNNSGVSGSPAWNSSGGSGGASWGGSGVSSSTPAWGGDNTSIGSGSMPQTPGVAWNSSSKTGDTAWSSTEPAGTGNNDSWGSGSGNKGSGFGGRMDVPQTPGVPTPAPSNIPETPSNAGWGSSLTGSESVGGGWSGGGGGSSWG
ncbi:hypothetical protein BB559_006521 [Furculomyces boomerangus]|uniref:Chromatin elongation factor SPT5 n=1 Tax=Furculomyces boomerangus TaxID=61424 RepID=A0A2T9Y2F6_9FUNG|nr:hypothetical protein BB559_006521 [Furculomyces boomerangus]